MHSMIQDLRYAARMLRCAPGFSVLAVLALTLGIGANTAVFTIVNGVLLRPLPYPEPNRLLLISDAARNGGRGPKLRLSDRNYLEFRRRDRLFEGLATFEARGADVTGAGEPVHMPVGAVTVEFMHILGIRPMMGRTFTGEDQRAGGGLVAVLGSSLWRERFAANPNIVGSTIKLDGIERTIVGVMPPGFTYPDGSQLWIPLEVRMDPHVTFLRPVVGRLKPAASRQQARAELQAMLPPGRVAEIQPFQNLVVADVREPLLIFAGAVGFVLLIACANVANLLLIRTASRRQEIAVRATLGAGVGRLMRQLLTESTVLSMIGGAAGLLLAMWGVPLLLELAPKGKFPQTGEIRVDRWALLFTFCISLLTGLLFGMAPGSHIIGRPLRESLAGNTRIAGRVRPGLRSALTIFELALALVLLTGAGLMLKSFLRMRAVDPGFRPANVLTMTVSLPDSVYRTARKRHAFQAKVLEKLSRLPGVTAAGAVDLLPFGDQMLEGDITVEGVRQLPSGYLVEKPCVSPGYFRAMGIRLLSGRDITLRDDLSAPGVAIVSQSVAREAWPGESAIGKRLSLESHPSPNDWLVVVGVVEDVRQYALTIGPGRAVYRAYSQAIVPIINAELTFAARTALDPVFMAPAMRRAVYEVDPDQPVKSVMTMQDRVAETTADPLFETRLLTAFSLVALLLAAIGIYGVVAYSVAERTREIGIRMALGAATADVVRDVLLRTLTLAAAGVLLGTAGALAATRVLSKLLFEVKAADPGTFFAVAALLAGVAILASWIPAKRATRVDPAVALRYE